jgi:hypothetical protein
LPKILGSDAKSTNKLQKKFENQEEEKENNGGVPAICSTSSIGLP